MEIQGTELCQWYIQNCLKVTVNYSPVHCHLFNNIIPRARMGSESIAHEAEGQMGYFSKIPIARWSKKYQVKLFVKATL